MLKTKFITNIYVALVARILLILFILQISRLGFYLFNQDFFPETTFFPYLKLASGGVLFDLTATFYANSIFILMQLIPFKFRYNASYKLVSKYIFLIINSVLLMLNSMDYVYYGFVKRRTTAIVFDEFKNDGNVSLLLLKALGEFWYITLFCMTLIALMTYAYNRVEIKKPIGTVSPLRYYSTSILLLMIGVAIVIIGIRGGLHGNKPIKIDKANDFISNIGEEAIVLNTPFSLFLTQGEKSLVERVYFDKSKLDSLYFPIHTPPTSNVMRKKNVVIITLESFGKEYIGALNRYENIDNYKGYTPFLDSLIGESVSFLHAFANGNRSIKAMPAIMASIPSTIEPPFPISSYSQNEYKSVVSVLKEEGYESMYYLGAQYGSLGIASFVKKAGVENYIGLEEYNNMDDYGNWGIWDEPFFKFTVDDISKYKEPFIASIFTLSSHYPFNLPKEYEGVFDKGYLDIHQTIGYSDNALRTFFEKAKTKSWYNNTLFVITSDHTSLYYYDKYKTLHGMYAVPLIFYTPSGELKKEERFENVQHIDIMPTVLDYLNYNKPFFSFGKSILQATEESDFAIYYHNNFYVTIYKEFLLLFDEKTSIAMYNYRKDWNLTEDILNQEKEIAKKMEDKTKAFIQTYTTCLINNTMTVENQSNRKF